MTRIIKKEVYCSKCKNNVVVPVLTSTSSFALEHDPKLKEKYLVDAINEYSKRISKYSIIEYKILIPKIVSFDEDDIPVVVEI